MIVACSGKIGSGKDTFADLLMKVDSKFQKKSFAFKLKQIVSLLTGTSLEDNLTQEGKKIVVPVFNKSLGEIQQIVGTEAMRKGFDENVWIKSLFADYNPETDFWIVSDVRFINEADYIKSIGGVLIRLEGDPADVRKNSNRDMTHPSETELDNYKGFNFIYKNDKSLREMEDFIKYVVLSKENTIS